MFIIYQSNINHIVVNKQYRYVIHIGYDIDNLLENFLISPDNIEMFNYMVKLGE